MLTDISGNGFTILSNNFVSPIYTPPQLFQSGLTIWYDFSDRSTIFSDTGATIPIQNGDFVRYVRNKAPNRPLYDLINTNATLNTTNSTVFCANTINTNKHSHIQTSQNAGAAQINLISLSGYSSSGKTAFTYSSFIRLPNTSFGTSVANMNVAGGGWQNVGGNFPNNSFNAYLYANQASTNMVGGTFLNGSIRCFISTRSVVLRDFVLSAINISTVSPARYFSFTFVFENNRNFSFYINNDLAFSGIGANTLLSGITTPAFGTYTRFHMMWAFGNTLPDGAGVGTEVNEVVFSDGEALTPEQVYRLNNYYFYKYNLENKKITPIQLNGPSN